MGGVDLRGLFVEFMDGSTQVIEYLSIDITDTLIKLTTPNKGDAVTIVGSKDWQLNNLCVIPLTAVKLFVPNCLLRRPDAS